MYYYGKLIRLEDGHCVEGYFQETYVRMGDSFVLHSSIENGGDIVIPDVIYAHEYGRSLAEFPEGAKHGDLLLETRWGYYWISLYRIPAESIV